MVAQLMSQHGFDLVGGEFVQQRVAQQDAACAPQPGQGSVGGLGAAAHIELVHAAHLRSGLRRQAFQAHCQAGVFAAQRFDLEEQRQEQHRPQLRQQHVEEQ